MWCYRLYNQTWICNLDALDSVVLAIIYYFCRKSLPTSDNKKKLKHYKNIWINKNEYNSMVLPTTFAC